MLERFKDRTGINTGGLALFVVLIAVSISIVIFVMTNGANPVGPSPVSPGGATPTPQPTATPQGLTSVLIVDNTTSGQDIQMSAVGDQIRFIRTNTVELDALGQTVGIGKAEIPNMMGTTDQFVMEDLATTLTNKTFDCTVNTCLNFPGGSSLVNNLPYASGETCATTDFSGVPGVTFQDSSGAFVTGGDIYYQPFQTGESITICDVSFEVDSAGNPGDGCRVGLYEDAGNMQPGDLVEDWGQIINDTTGHKHATVSTTISPGAYLIAMICDSGPGLRNYNGKSYLSGGVDTSTTASARFIENMRVSAPTGTPYTSGFAATGEEWDAVDLNTSYNYGYWILLRW